MVQVRIERHILQWSQSGGHGSKSVAQTGGNSAAPERRAPFVSASSATVPALDFEGLVRTVAAIRAGDCPRQRDRPSPEKYLTPVAAPPPATCSMGFEALRWARGILESVASAGLISINAGRRRRLSAFDGRDHDAAMMSFASRHSPRLPQLTLRRRARCDRSPAHRRALRSRVLLDACRRGATAE
jgi:hypothetical protein